MIKRLWESPVVKFIREMVELYFSCRVSRSAAELAYFLILTFFPILICINAFVGVVGVNVDAILNTLQPILPPSLLAIVSDYLGYITVNESSGLLAAGLFMTLFSASAAMRSLMDVMKDLYGKEGFHGFWQIVASVLFSVLLLVAIYLSIIVVLTGSWFFHLVEQYLPRWEWLAGLQNWNGQWQWLRFGALFGVAFLLVVLIYYLTAPRGEPRAPVLLGALLASIALVGASAIFSMFIGMSSQYSLVYGSLASVIITLIWLFICGNVLILGSVFNCVRYRHKKDKKSEKTS